MSLADELAARCLPDPRPCRCPPRPRAGLARSANSKLRDVEALHPGIDTFLKRQRKARLLKEERENVPHVNGENWTNQVRTQRVGALARR